MSIFSSYFIHKSKRVVKVPFALIVSWSLFSWSLEEQTWEHYWKTYHDYFLSHCHFFACQFQQVCLNFDIEPILNWIWIHTSDIIWNNIGKIIFFLGSQRRKILSGRFIPHIHIKERVQMCGNSVPENKEHICHQLQY